MRVRDEVCRKKLDMAEAEATVEYQGRQYFFCSEQCREAFEEDPLRYLPAYRLPEGAGGRHRRHL